MTYVDGFVLVVPKKNREAYKKMASEGAKMWMKCGALQYFECVGDDLNPKGAMLTFPKIMKPKKNEEIWFSFITFKSKAHRDSVNKKVMKEMEKTKDDWKNVKMPFDMQRMAYGGFKTIVQK